MTPLILTLLFVLIVAVGALIGFVRGLNKAVIRVMTFALAIILTFILAAPITSLIADSIQIQGGTLGEFILSQVQGKNEMLDGILESAPLLEEAILTAPEFLIGFVIFPVAFMLLSFISWILFLCLQKPLRKVIFKEFKEKDENGKPVKAKVGVGKRFAGLGIGLASGVLVFAMFMAPLFGLVSVLPEKSALDHTVDVLVEQELIDSDMGTIIKGELAVMESPVYTVPSALGLSPIGKSYLASVSKIERDGEVTYLTDEFSTLFAVVETAIEGEFIGAILKSSEDMNALYAALADEAFVQELIGDMFNSKLLRSAIPEVTAIALESAARMLGVPENKQEVYDNMMSDIATLVKDSDVDFDGIHAYEEANNISYADVMFADEQERRLMTEEEYNKEIEKLGKLEEKIAKVVDKSVAGGSKSVAKGIAKGFVKVVKEQVKTEGIESIKDFKPENVQQKMAEMKPEDIVIVPAEGEEEGDAAANQQSIADMLGKIQEPEKFETELATVETVKESIRETVKDAVKDESKTNETASTLANVVSNFAGAVSSATDENGKFDQNNLDFEKIGNAVDSLQGSTLNNVGSAVLDIVVSGDLGKNDMISSAVSGIKDAYDAGEKVSDTVKTTGDILGLVTEMNKSEGETTEGLIKSFEGLVKGLTETTLNILPNIISDDVLIGMGVPEKHTKAAYNVIDTLLRELMKLKGAADYDNEVNAVLSIYNIATGGMDKIESDDLPKLAGYAVKSDAIFNTLNSVSTSNPFGIEIKSEETRNDFVKAIEDGYAESIKTESDKQRVYDTYMAIATLLGIEADVELAK